MRMARINVYLPDDLATAAREQGLNVSRLTQDAVRDALAASETDAWLEALPDTTGSAVSHDDVMRALDEARAEFGDDR